VVKKRFLRSEDSTPCRLEKHPESRHYSGQSERYKGDPRPNPYDEETTESR
jgi:hypothetical protein